MKNRIGGYFSNTVMFLDRRGEMVVGELTYGELIKASGRPDPGMTLADEMGTTFWRMHVRVGDEKIPRVVDGPAESAFAFGIQPKLQQTVVGEHARDQWCQEVDVPPTRSFDDGEPVGTAAGDKHRDVTFSTSVASMLKLDEYLGRRIRWMGKVWVLYCTRSDGAIGGETTVTLRMKVDGSRGVKERPVHILTLVRKFKLVERPAPEGL